MHLVRIGAPGSRKILNQICPFKISPLKWDPMGAVATYLAHQIQVKLKMWFNHFEFGSFIFKIIYKSFFNNDS